MKILVAEDNLINQKIIRIILEKSGLEYEMVNNGQEAVASFESSKYSLVLMDCQMPVMDGIQASSQIRKLEQEKKSGRCAIVAMTANAMKGDKERCLAAGMDDFLAKPFKSQDLAKMISSWSSK